VATLLAPFVESCGGDMRELDRARCRSTTAFLRQRLPQQTFVVTSSDPAAIDVSGYDAAVKGYHVVLAGCIACTEPIPVGPQHEPRFVTLNPPDKGAASLAAGVTISKSTVAFDDLQAAKKWAETERPFLKAEFLFQPQATGADYTVGMAPGIALKLVGAAHRMGGDLAAAEEALGKAARLAAVSGDALTSAEIRFQLACALAAGGHRTVAEETWSRSLLAFERIGARQWAARVRDRLTGGENGRYF